MATEFIHEMIVDEINLKFKNFSYSLQSTEADKMECPVSFIRCFMFLYVVKHKTTELLVFVTSKY